MAIVLLVVLLISLLMIPLGLPGTWVICAAALVYQLRVPAGGIGTATVVSATILTVAVELMEFTLSARYTRKYGGSRRAGWGAVVGGIVGAIIGVPVVVVGSVIGAFIGSFVGALLLELTSGSSGKAATRVAWGALLGRVVSTAIKVGAGVAMSAWVLLKAILG